LAVKKQVKSRVSAFHPMVVYGSDRITLQCLIPEQTFESPPVNNANEKSCRWFIS
jgi:hypothetical protein